MQETLFLTTALPTGCTDLLNDDSNLAVGTTAKCATCSSGYALDSGKCNSEFAYCLYFNALALKLLFYAGITEERNV